jgi:hypothetical protein
VRILLAAFLLGSSAGAQTVVVRNNHEIPYRGPVEVGERRVFVSLAPHAESTVVARPSRGNFAAKPAGNHVALSWRSKSLADVAFGLVVLPGATATIDDALAHFAPLPLGASQTGDYNVVVSTQPDANGFLDASATVVRARGNGQPAYVALVRRVVTPNAHDAKLRFNGRVFDTAVSPDTWDRDFWYVRGVDWLAWKSGDVSLLAVNRFTPVPTVKPDSVWKEGSHFYVWEKTRQKGDTTFLISEIAGPNVEQVKSRYMPVSPYAALTRNDTVRLAWRLAVAESPEPTWAESQLRVYAGTRTTRRDGNVTRVALGVPHTTFGVSYFPYSTFTENLDYYRVPGMTSENFWPIAPPMWAQWRKFIPAMQTDFRIIRSMGFDVVRLHHAELLQKMERKEALAFLDFYAAETRAMGMTWLLDTEGPPAFIKEIVTRYADLVHRVELENEVLIGGIGPGDADRWSGLYAAVKQAKPDAQVIFTGAGNNAMFERLRTLGVPFDRVGLHAYKHGPQWQEAYSSHVLGTAGYATSIGKEMSIGEFNWKDFTKLSPEQRRNEFISTYENVLSPRVVPELYQFQFQEQMAFNPAVGGSASRHYEVIGLDRRPKAEAFETMRLIRKYGRADAPVNTLPIVVDAARIIGGKARVAFTVTNATGRAVTATIASLTFDGAKTALTSPKSVTLASGASAKGSVDVSLAATALPGTYHHFIEVRAGGITSLGWGVLSNEGAPTFADTSVLGARVRYAQGPAVVRELDWNRPIAVVFGDRTAVLELEDAYQLGNTLQAATGRPVRISSEKDLPADIATRGLVFLVGTAMTNALVASTGVRAEAGVGTIALDRANGRQWVVLTGADAKGVEAAVVELEMRYWPNAKYSAMRLVGFEKGAALGNRTGGSSVDLP